jgi:hypothetical protein
MSSLAGERKTIFKNAITSVFPPLIPTTTVLETRQRLFWVQLFQGFTSLQEKCNSNIRIITSEKVFKK